MPSPEEVNSTQGEKPLDVAGQIPIDVSRAMDEEKIRVEVGSELPAIRPEQQIAAAEDVLSGKISPDASPELVDREVKAAKELLGRAKE